MGDLTFYGQTWAFKGKKGKLPPLNTDEIAAKADLIVITQVNIHVAQIFCPGIKIVEQHSLHELTMLPYCRFLILSMHSAESQALSTDKAVSLHHAMYISRSRNASRQTLL